MKNLHMPTLSATTMSPLKAYFMETLTEIVSSAIYRVKDRLAKPSSLLTANLTSVPKPRSASGTSNTKKTTRSTTASTEIVLSTATMVVALEQFTTTNALTMQQKNK
jgi:hypothetical protein